MLDGASCLPSSDCCITGNKEARCNAGASIFRIESTFVQFISRLPHEKHLKCHLISDKYKAEGLGPASLKSTQALFSKGIGSGTEKILPNVRVNGHGETNKPAS